MKKIRTRIIVPLIILVAGFIVTDFYVWRVWWPAKQIRIAQGLATFEFPFRDYSVAELNKMYPQIKNADVPTRVTPEETYAKFREALRTNDLELALDQLSKESKKYQDNVRNLQQAYTEKRFVKSLSLYPEKIWRSNFGQSIGNICYDQEQNNSKSVGCTDFIKDANGDWKMDSL